MQLNFDSDDHQKTPNVDWADREKWVNGDRVLFEVMSADLLEVMKDGESRLKIRFLYKVGSGENAGLHTTKEVWDPLKNKKTQKYLKFLLGECMGVPQEKLKGGNVPLCLAESVGSQHTAVCELTNGGKWVNWNDPQSHGGKPVYRG